MKRSKQLQYCRACGKDKYYSRAKSAETGEGEMRCAAGHLIATQYLDHKTSEAAMAQLTSSPRFVSPPNTGFLRGHRATGSFRTA
jgi:hypothetical protein